MNLNQEAKSVIAVTAAVCALILALNDVALAAGGRDMLPWSLGLLLAAIFFWVWMRRDARAGGRGDAMQAAEEAVMQAEALAQREQSKSETPASTPVSTPAKPGEPDDLTRIKGLGAKYQRDLNQAGITTYQALADATLEDLQAIFSYRARGGPAYLTSYRAQAEYAARGDWEGLRAYQDSL